MAGLAGADLLIGRVRRRPAGKARRGDGNARQHPEQPLGRPEPAEGEHRSLGPLGEGPLQRHSADRMRRRRRDRRLAPRQGFAGRRAASSCGCTCREYTSALLPKGRGGPGDHRGRPAPPSGRDPQCRGCRVGRGRPGDGAEDVTASGGRRDGGRGVRDRGRAAPRSPSAPIPARRASASARRRRRPRTRPAPKRAARARPELRQRRQNDRVVGQRAGDVGDRRSEGDGQENGTEAARQKADHGFSRRPSRQASCRVPQMVARRGTGDPASFAPPCKLCRSAARGSAAGRRLPSRRRQQARRRAGTDQQAGVSAFHLA